jgi:DNA-binding transcriptional LysR family regulator
MNFSGFDLNLLKVLDALLREGSTVRAGQRAGLSQPAVSAALSRLRNALNDPLFVREGRGLVATEFALSLETPLREMLDSVDTMLAGPGNFDPGGSTLSFKISGSDFFSELLMPQLADHLNHVAPQMRVQLVDLVPDSYTDTLERYGVDIALIPFFELPDWVDHRVIFHSKFVTIARRDHPALAAAGIRDGDPIPIELFCSLSHALFSPEGKLRAMGDEALAKAGYSRNVAITMPFFSGIYRAVAQSDLIALMPHQLAAHVADRAGLTLHAPPIPVPVAKICMVWHKRMTNSPSHRWIRDQIARIMAPLDQKNGAA